MKVDPDQQAFVEAAMSPLGDDRPSRELLELSVVKAAVLPKHGCDEPAVSTDRMRSTAGVFMARNKLTLALSILVALLSSWMSVAGPPAWKSWSSIAFANRAISQISSHENHITVTEFFEFFGGSTLGDGSLIANFASSLSEKDTRLLVGDLSSDDSVSRWKAVWDEYPGDAGHYFAYALAHLKEHAAWPADFVETGEKLDPGNGWFKLLYGATKAESAIGIPHSVRITKEERFAARREGRQATRTPLPPNPQKVILDPMALGEAMQLLDEALAMPRLDDYRAHLRGVRFKAIPPATDLASHYANTFVTTVPPESFSEGWSIIGHYVQAFRLIAAEAVQREETEELGEIRDRVTLLTRRLLELPSPEVFTVRAILFHSLAILRSSWTALDDPEKAKEFDSIHAGMNGKMSPLVKRATDALDESRGSHLLARFHGTLDRPGSMPITEPEIRAGRLAEYALYERLMLHVAGLLLFLVVAFLGISRQRAKRAFGLLPDRLEGLLGTRDHLWIFFQGVLLPIVIYAVATRNPWISPREFILNQGRFVTWLLQAAAVVAVIVLWTIQAASRRLGKRGGVVHLGWLGRSPGPWLAIMAIIPLVAGPSLLAFQPHDSLIWRILLASLGISVGVPWLWIAVLASGRFASPERRLHRATLVRTITPFIAFAMLPVAISIPMVYAEEKRWIAELDFDALREKTSAFEPRTNLESEVWYKQYLRRPLEDLQRVPGE